MDSLTHIVLGGCLGEAIGGKKLGKKAILWGAIADTIPDLDVLINPFIHPVNTLMTHRGFMHSILFSLLLPPLIGFLLSKYYRKDKSQWQLWTAIIYAGMLSHLGIDSLTNYGTGLLEPFSHTRFSYTTIFIADPAFTLPMFLAFFTLLFIKTNNVYRNKIAVIALILSAIYLSWTFINRAHFEKLFDHALKQQEINYTSQSITPSPLNNILWGSTARSDSGYYIGFHSLLDTKPKVDFNYVPSNLDWAKSFSDNENYKTINRFAQNYGCISLIDGIQYYHDLRFGQMNAWTSTPGDFTFNYPLIKDSLDQTKLIKTDPWSKARIEGFGSLWDRIKGN